MCVGVFQDVVDRRVLRDRQGVPDIRCPFLGRLGLRFRVPIIKRKIPVMRTAVYCLCWGPPFLETTKRGCRELWRGLTVDTKNPA